MKNLTLFMLMLFVSGTLVTISCEKTDDTDNGGDDPNPTKKKVLVERSDVQSIDASSQVFSYNADKNIEKQLLKDKNKLVVKAIVYKYDASKHIYSYTTYQDEALSILVSVTNYTLNTSAQVTKSVNDETGAITTTTYSYQSGKLVNAHIEYSGSATGDPMEFELEWTADNVSKITHKIPDTTGAGGFIVDGYITIQYDDKVNPYAELKLLQIDPLYLSKNNMTKVEAFDANGIILHLATYSFNYDGDYPISGSYDLGFLQGQYAYVYTIL